MRTKYLYAAFPLFFGFFCLCGSLAAGPQNPLAHWKGKITTQDGVKTVSNPAEPLLGRIALDLEEDLVLGNDVDENLMFFYRFDVAVDRADNIYIHDPRSYCVRKFDRTGKFLQTIGRQGQGPGEFQNLNSIWCDERGNLQVVDAGKVHIFDSSGQFQKSIATAMNARQAVVFPDGSMARMNLVFAPDKFLEEIVLTDGSGRIVKTLASFGSQKIEVSLKQKPKFVIDYPEILLCGWTSSLALFAYPSEYKLAAADSLGRVVMIIQKDGRPDKITSQDRNRTFEQIIAQYPKEKDNRAELERRTFFPEFRPFFDLIQSDVDGWVYIRRMIPGSTKDGPREYDVFDREGRFLSTVTFSGDACLLNRGFLYTRKYDNEKQCVRMVRWKIKNWDKAIIRLP